MYRNKLHIFGVCLLAVLSYGLSGCSDGKKVEKPADTTPLADPATGSRVAASKPRIEDVPADLKHDAFYYYGFDNLAPVDMETTQGKIVSTGARINRLTEIKGDTVSYEVENTGSLAMLLGNQQMSVEKDGIYSTGLSTGKMTPEKILEIPADLTAGKTWSNNTVITFEDGRTFKADHTYKVVGPQKVKTKAGDFDSILVQAGGPTELNGQKFNSAMKIWLVKGVGPVKMEMSAKVGGKLETNVIQATKVNK